MDYFRHIDYNKHSVIFAVSNDIFSSYFEKEGLPVKVIKFPQIQYQERFLNKFLTFYNFLKEIRPDCVVINQFWMKSFRLPELLSAFLIAKGNVYMIVHDCPPIHPEFKGKLHFGIFPGLGLWWRKERLLQTSLAYFTKYTIAVSKATGEILHNQHRFPRRKIKIVYHGIDTGKFSPSQENRTIFRNDLKISGSDKIIVSTARLDIVKRLDRLIEAFNTLALQRKDIQLIFVGIGQQHNTLVGMVNSLDKDVSARIKFLGFREDIPKILQACDIYVLPSDNEGLPIACLEAMSCGLIAVVTDCGGTKEIIKHGNNGFIVEKSKEGILDGLKIALSMPEETKNRVCENARKFVVDNFKLEENIRRGLGLLKISHLP